MAEKDEEDTDDQEDGAEDAPPESILRHFARRAPPTRAELERFRADFPRVVKAYSGLVWNKLRGKDISPESQRHLHQDVFTTLFALVKRFNVPVNLALTVSSIAWRTVKAYLRNRVRKAMQASIARPELIEGSEGPEPGVYFELLLNEVAGQLPPADVDLLRWFGVEGYSCEEIAAWLGIPVGTAKSRMRAARKRLLAILNPPSENEPTT